MVRRGQCAHHRTAALTLRLRSSARRAHRVASAESGVDSRKIRGGQQPIADRADAAARPASIHVKVYKDPGANFRWNV